MGQAKQKRLAAAAQAEAIAQIDFAGLAAAVRKIMTAASESLGVDCLMHAVMTKAVLAELGVDATIEVGEAAWRIGEGDADVICHLARMAPNAKPGEWPYHAWLNVQGNIFDVTTYQLPIKAKMAAEVDGQPFSITWSPEFMFVRKDQCSSERDVTKLHAGLFYYGRIPAIEPTVLSGAQPDPYFVDAILLAYRNPDVNVVGPNHGVSSGPDA